MADRPFPGDLPPGLHVLVHGGCHGAWCWSEVIDGLAQRGIQAVALDLPGCGADRTPRTEVTLASEVRAVTDLLDALVDSHGPQPVRLVGHSIGGWLLPPVAAARPDRVESLVFVAAAVLRTGQSGIDVTPAERRPGYAVMAAESGDNSLLPSFPDAWNRFFPSLDEPSARDVYARLTPQAYGPYLEKATTGIDQVSASRSYLLMEDDRTYPPEVAEDFAAAAGVIPVRIPGDHCVMLTDPQALIDALVRL